MRINHVLDGVNCNERRTKVSSMMSGILAAVKTPHRGSLLAKSLTALHKAAIERSFVLMVDSPRSYFAVTALHEGSDYSLRPTIARMRGAFENRENLVMHWPTATPNPPNELDKILIEMFKMLNGILPRGL